MNICDRTPQVRDAILSKVGTDDCAAVDSERLASVKTLFLHGDSIVHFDGKRLTALQVGDFEGLNGLQILDLTRNLLATLPDGVFDGLSNLQELDLLANQLTALPDSVFDELDNLQSLGLGGNRLTTLPDGVFDGLSNLQELDLLANKLTELPDSVFDGLDSLQELGLLGNQLTALPDGVFDELDNLQTLSLVHNQLTALPDGVFDGLDDLQKLFLDNNRLMALPDGVFDELDNLQSLGLGGNRLTTLPGGVFDGLSNLQALDLRDNKLTALPDGVFDGLSSLQELWLLGNRLVRLTRDDPLFAAFSSQVNIQLRIPRLVAAVPLMLSASNSGKQGFVRIVNEGDESGFVRVFAFDDGGNAPDLFLLFLGARQVVHFNANDLENGNLDKNIENGVVNKAIIAGVGKPVEGDWRLDIETDSPVRVMSFVRHTDGFLTAMHDVLPRTDDGRLAAHTFNPGRNTDQASKLRLVNTSENDAPVSIEGVDDSGNTAGPVTLTLPAGESRTFSAVDLESGTHGLSGSLGDGEGKWRLFVTAGSSVVGMSLLESANGNLTNISTMGVATDG